MTSRLTKTLVTSALAITVVGSACSESATTDAGPIESASASSGVGGEGGTSSASESASASGGAGGAGGQGAEGGAGGQGGEPPLTVAKCYEGVFVNASALDVDYDQFKPVVGSHCLGTNHQTIEGVERVVFLGDSVAAGTPPTLSPDFFRAKLANALADKFGLAKPDLLWQSVNPFDGKSIVKESGGFASCAKWGARTDDLMPTQIPDCLPKNRRDKRTLVVITMGGNDIANLTKMAIDGKPDAELWAATEKFVALQREAVEWLKAPGRFPNGVFVVFSNMYEFTDGTGEVQSCNVSALAGFDKPVPAPAKLAEMVIWANEQFLQIAVENQVDAIFMLEEFCGHGFNSDDPTAPCYRGPGNANWFDLTCTHPNPTGHDQIHKMYLSVVNE